MNAAAPDTPNISSADRLGLTLFLALALHAIIIFGVSFDLLNANDSDDLPTMEVTLVNNRSDEAPKQADYLAQANQKGGGNVDKKVKPGAPFSNPKPSPDQGVAPATRPAVSPPLKPKHQPQREVLSTQRTQPEHAPKPKDQPKKTLPDHALDAAQLIERSQQIARLSAEIQRRQEAYAHKPRETYISSANARKYRLAAYMDAWQAKVERVGNLNYPDEARRRGLTGSLLLDVAINPDGTVRSVQVLRSSGEQVLDDAAKRIVHLAAPFAPLSKNIRKDTDILHIIRTWQFDEGSGLQTFGR
ncbi:MAG TPA: energy transducer TonB [Gammaproteobacteria bacterium]|nr:energy transducer TonB [Gammaproteobacteria bacterium]